MARRFWKEIIRPERVFVDLGTTDKGREIGIYDVDMARIAKIHETAKDMLSCRLSIPVPLEHGPEVPSDRREAEANLTQFNRGWVRDSRVSASGALEMLLEVDDETGSLIDAGKIAGVSPAIEQSWIDGKGRHWEDAVLHVALTNKAVIQPQANFRAVADVAASAVRSPLRLLPRRITGAIFSRLSVPQGTKLRVMKSGRLSFEGERMDDDEKPLDDDAAVETETGESVDELLDLPGAGSENQPTSVDREVSPELVQAMANLGLFVPPGTKLSELETVLIVGANTARMSDELNDESEPTNMLPADDEAATQQQGFIREESTPTVQLSRSNGGAMSKVKSRFESQGSGQPTKGKPISSVQLSRELQASNAALMDRHRQSLVDKADNLRQAGKMPPQSHDAFVKRVKSVKLSVRAGSVVDESGLADDLSQWSAIENGVFLSNGAVRSHSPPREYFDNAPTPSDEDIAESGSEWDKAVGRKGK
jgi:hypothetical protein